MTNSQTAWDEENQPETAIDQWNGDVYLWHLSSGTILVPADKVVYVEGEEWPFAVLYSEEQLLVPFHGRLSVARLFASISIAEGDERDSMFGNFGPTASDMEGQIATIKDKLRIARLGALPSHSWSCRFGCRDGRPNGKDHPA